MALSKIEQLKAERNPLEMIKDIYKEANEGIPIDDDHIGLLKWYGMYPHKDDPKYFMKRIKFTENGMNIDQLKVMVEIGEKYANNYIDFTTRQNVQLHYIQIKDLPKVFDLLDSVGMTSRLASGDGPRPMVGCPVSGFDKDDLYDMTPLLKEIDKYFDTHSDKYANLPRKYKIGLSGCSKHCMGHEIQDVGFTAFKDDSGEVLFDLSVGGGLSKTKTIARRAKRYVKENQIKDIAIKCCEIFNDLGNRENRAKARVRDLVTKMGVEAFVDELEKRLGYDLQIGENEPSITPYEQRTHFGIHEEKRDGYSYVGCATRRGRVQATGLKKIYEIVKKYGAEGIKLTPTQNFVVYGVKTEIAPDLAKDMEEAGFSSNPTVFSARTQSCTGKPHCKFAITETKDFTDSIIGYLEDKFPDLNDYLSIAVSGCGNGCSHPHIADIGLIGCKVKGDEGERVEGFTVHLGGRLQGEHKSVFAYKTGIKLPHYEVGPYIEGLINEFKTSSNNNFQEFIQGKASTYYDI